MKLRMKKKNFIKMLFVILVVVLMTIRSLACEVCEVTKQRDSIVANLDYARKMAGEARMNAEAGSKKATMKWEEAVKRLSNELSAIDKKRLTLEKKHSGQ